MDISSSRNCINFIIIESNPKFDNNILFGFMCIKIGCILRYKSYCIFTSYNYHSCKLYFTVHMSLIGYCYYIHHINKHIVSLFISTVYVTAYH